MNRISRRDMLKVMGVTGAAAMTPYSIRHVRAAGRPVPRVNILKSYPYEDREVFETDLVIVGTGLGGLWAAVTAAEEGIKRIAIVDKGGLGVSSGSGMILAGTLYWLEGDERFTIDGELVIHGTGSEDYFNCGWYAVENRLNKPGALPLHGFPVYRENVEPTRAVAYRWHVADPVPYEKSIIAEIEHGGDDKFAAHYQSVTYFYDTRAGSVSLDN